MRLEGYIRFSQDIVMAFSSGHYGVKGQDTSMWYLTSMILFEVFSLDRSNQPAAAGPGVIVWRSLASRFGQSKR